MESMIFSTIEFLKNLLSELDGHSKTVTIPGNEIKGISLRYGYSAERAIIQAITPKTCLSTRRIQTFQCNNLQAFLRDFSMLICNRSAGHLRGKGLIPPVYPLADKPLHPYRGI